MADRDWLRNLTAATLTDGVWRHPAPEAVARLAERRVAEALIELEGLARDYGAAWQEISGGKGGGRVLHVLDLPGSTGGFMLLLGRCQIVLQAQPAGLAATLVTAADYARRSRPLARLEPQVDAFGTVAWRWAGEGDANALLMQGELIIKRLIEAISRAAQEA